MSEAKMTLSDFYQFKDVLNKQISPNPNQTNTKKQESKYKNRILIEISWLRHDKIP